MSIRLWQGDCLQIMDMLPDNSVDAIITDPPYGTTDQAWDIVIPFAPMWEQLLRIAKPHAPIVLFAAQPYTSLLITSAPRLFRYAWVWEKNVPGGFAQAKNKPMPIHEDIVVFSTGKTGHAVQCKNRMPYFPQGLTPFNKVVKNAKGDRPSAFEARPNARDSYVQEFTGYPTSVLKFDVERTGLHANQKPVLLMKYLIETYSQPGETVLDFSMGSGSTGIAAVRTGRSFIGIEKDAATCQLARERIKTEEKLWTISTTP